MKYSKTRNYHGLSNHPLYYTWHNMMDRCNDVSHKAYKDYGGRGIKVCDKWHDVKNFIEDMLPAWKENLVIDRKDNNGNYEPDNCRWLTRSANMKNRRVKAVKVSNSDHVKYVKHHDRWYYSRGFKTQEEAEKFAEKVNY